MKGRFVISRLLLLMSMLAMIGVSLLAIRVLEEDVHAYRDSNQEPIHWTTAQVEVELARFQLDLTRYLMSTPSVSLRDVNLRFDLLWSRAKQFNNGKVGERLRSFDEGIGAIPQLLAKLEQYEPQIVTLPRGLTPEAEAMAQDFADLRAPLRRLSNNVTMAEHERFAEVRNSLLSGSQKTFWVWVSTLVITAVLFGVILIEGRRYARMIRETAKLAEEAQAADRTKSRFLTMMSHELRTPMNGVMGLMALVKQTGMNERQVRLIDQAERSGAQMVALLDDILDFSDLQAERMELERQPVRTTDLLDAIDSAMAELNRRYQLTSAVTTQPGMVVAVSSDMTRVTKALTHFMTYLVEIVGCRELSVSIGHDGENLLINLDVDAHGSDEPGWQPEAIFGHDGTNHGEFATDSVGPSIARNIIELMDGRVRIQRPMDDHACLMISIPAEEVPLRRDGLRIETFSDTSRMLLRAAVDNDVWEVWDRGHEMALVTVILIEGGHPDELALIAQFRLAHPQARIVSVGTPTDHELVDDVCEFSSVRAILLECQSASGGNHLKIA